MKKLILFSAVVTASLVSTSAQADIIRCVFTEPFVTSVYSTSQQTLTYDTSFMNKKKGSVTVFKNVSFQIKGAGKFELVAKDGKVLQSLDLTNKGSDGSSDNVFPFEVNDKTNVIFENKFGVDGGCSSNYLKMAEQN